MTESKKMDMVDYFRQEMKDCHRISKGISIAFAFILIPIVFWGFWFCLEGFAFAQLWKFNICLVGTVCVCAISNIAYKKIQLQQSSAYALNFISAMLASQVEVDESEEDSKENN